MQSKKALKIYEPMPVLSPYPLFFAGKETEGFFCNFSSCRNPRNWCFPPDCFTHLYFETCNHENLIDELKDKSY